MRNSHFSPMRTKIKEKAKRKNDGSSLPLPVLATPIILFTHTRPVMVDCLSLDFHAHNVVYLYYRPLLIPPSQTSDHPYANKVADAADTIGLQDIQEKMDKRSVNPLKK